MSWSHSDQLYCMYCTDYCILICFFVEWAMPYNIKSVWVPIQTLNPEAKPNPELNQKMVSDAVMVDQGPFFRPNSHTHLIVLQAKEELLLWRSFHCFKWKGWFTSWIDLSRTKKNTGKQYVLICSEQEESICRNFLYILNTWTKDLDLRFFY